MSDRATDRQKSTIKSLLEQAEYDHRTVGASHRRWGVEERHIGQPVDNWLADLNPAQASRLIDKLKEATDSGDDEDED